MKQTPTVNSSRLRLGRSPARVQRIKTEGYSGITEPSSIDCTIDGGKRTEGYNVETKNTYYRDTK